MDSANCVHSFAKWLDSVAQGTEKGPFFFKNCTREDLASGVSGHLYDDPDLTDDGPIHAHIVDAHPFRTCPCPDGSIPQWVKVSADHVGILKSPDVLVCWPTEHYDGSVFKARRRFGILDTIASLRNMASKLDE